MPKVLKPMQVYPHLPKTNCGKCGEVSCMAFAVKLIGREVTPEKCPPILEPENRANFEALVSMLSPLVKAVTIGVGERAVTIGGKDSMYRHEVAFPNPTAISIDIHDEMTEAEIAQRVKQVEGFIFNRMGQDLRLDLIAARCVSGNPVKFEKAVSVAIKNSSLPLMLCSFDPSALGEALKVVGNRKPLLYAATEQNWEDMGRLALQYGCPLAIFAPDIGMLKTMSHALWEIGVKDIVLDPGTYFKGTGLSTTIDNFTMIRRAAIEKEDRDLGYPLMAVPAAVWLTAGGDTARFLEAYLASMFIARFADLVVIHSMDIWAILPVITLRQCIYTDPRKPVAVEAGLREIGSPRENSPVLQTSNFALTYFAVLNDIKDINCYLIVVDTGGLAVQSAVAGGQLDASVVAEAIKTAGVEQKVKHRKLIVPGYESRLKGEIEDLTKWEVMVGPIDSSQIPDFLKKYWTES